MNLLDKYTLRDICLYCDNQSRFFLSFSPIFRNIIKINLIWYDDQLKNMMVNNSDILTDDLPNSERIENILIQQQIKKNIYSLDIKFFSSHINTNTRQHANRIITKIKNDDIITIHGLEYECEILTIQ